MLAERRTTITNPIFCTISPMIGVKKPPPLAGTAKVLLFKICENHYSLIIKLFECKTI